MDIRLQSLHFEASEHLKTFTNEKVAKLFEQSDKVIFADVTLYSEGDPVENQVCEIRIGIAGEDPFVKKASPSYEQSIHECVEALQKILRRQKEKEVNQRNDA